MQKLRVLIFGTVLAVGSALAADPDLPALRRQHTHEFSHDGRTLAGPGAALLREQTAGAQFVLLGEVHMDREVPRFAGALFNLLHRHHGFSHLVVEQDPLAMEEAMQRPLRGDVQALGAHARRYPGLFEFDSDSDLALIAQVGLQVSGPDAIWGVEQVTGAVRHLELLLARARTSAQRQATQALLDTVRTADPGPNYSVNWLGSVRAEPDLRALRPLFGRDPAALARIDAMAKSAEIFGYYRRAEAGEPVGLFNNTVREEVLKANFIARYRAAARTRSLPKAMFKFGSNHLYRGKNPTQAFPIGNLAHELAVFNGCEAYGLYVMALGPGYVGLQDLPAWMKPLLPDAEPLGPLLVDLRALRPYQRWLRADLADRDQAAFRELINGYDALVLLTGSARATREFSGRAPY
jgi:hypothetical protein